nr:MAG: internal scaffolding protein [Microvirus sp.]
MAKAAKRAFFRDHERVLAPLEYGIDASMTRQEFQEECDINSIMKRYQRTGVISHMNKTAPQYLDLSDVPDLQQSLNVMMTAEAAFMRLPAVVRREFNNDAVEFVDFASKAESLPKMREWGLAPPVTAPAGGEGATPPMPPAPPADKGDQKSS